MSELNDKQRQAMAEFLARYTDDQKIRAKLMANKQ